MPICLPLVCLLVGIFTSGSFAEPLEKPDTAIAGGLIRIHGTNSFGYPLFRLDRDDLRTLFQDRSFDRLTDMVEDLQRQVDRDFRLEDVLDEVLGVLAPVDPALQGHFDEWVRQHPASYAPYLVRAAYFLNIGVEARGRKWRKDTTDEQIAAMRRAMALAEADVERALKINSRLPAAYELRIELAKF